MDILGSNMSGGNSFLKFKSNEGEWWVNNESVIDFTYMQIDTSTIKSGWGIYSNNGFDHVWDEKLGIKCEKPDDIGEYKWKRAFSVWLFLDGRLTPVLCRSHAFGELKSFSNILPLFWNQLDQAREGTLPTVKYTGHDIYKVGKGNTSNIKFEFVDFKPRKPEFVVPEWAADDEPEAIVEMQATEQRKEITNEDIPF